MLAPIFRSDGQARLLAELILTGDELSLADLAKRSDLAYPTVHREVARLEQAGILAERQVGRSRLVRADDESPLVGPLRQILLVTTGPAVLLAHELALIDGIESALIFGSFAARLKGVPGAPPSDIDLMVIGTPDAEEVYAACDRVEQAVHRPINPTILARAEASKDSGFLKDVSTKPVVPIIGEVPWS